MKHLQINFVLIFLTIMCFDFGILQGRMRRNLSSLVNLEKPSTVPVDTKKPALVVVTQNPPPTVATKPVYVAQKPGPDNVHKKNDEALLNGFAAQQTNPDRTAALQILNNEQLAKAYRQDLMAIDLLFLEFSVQALSPYNAQASVKHGKANLSSLISVIAPPSTLDSGIKHLSDLIGLIQAHTTVTSTGGIEKKHIELLNLIHDLPATSTITKKSKNNLSGLISVSNSGPVVTKRKRNLLGLVG